MNEPENHSPPSSAQPFSIKDCALIAIATGSRADTIKELSNILSTISQDSIYYHFWGGLLQPRFEEREYNNDFAAWAWYSLHDAPLAERLAVIDPTEFQNLEDLRHELLEIMEERLEEKEVLNFTYATSRFEFIRSQIVIFDTRKKAGSPEDLAAVLPALSTGSIFYHFIDARRRLDKHEDDFSSWLKGYGVQYDRLCRQLASIDPYFGSLNTIKNQLTDVFAGYFA